jgi:pimeloyl-ACP methyl ester carboxylesterase
MRTAIRLSILAVVALTAGAVFVAEGALHIWQRELPDDRLAAAVAKADGAAWREAQVGEADGVKLSGWLLTPGHGNGAVVIALHGVGDTRAGMLGHADFLLRAGYTVLAPDCRGHGRSGGDVISYGVREGGDVRAWEDLLLRTPGVERIYGIGQSMGAAILLESLGHATRMRALVADCPFATFQEIAYERLEQQGVIGEAASWPLVNLGFVYARARYIAPRHSRELHAANLAATDLWEVPGAGHIASLEVARGEYVRRVTEWFDRHR